MFEVPRAEYRQVAAAFEQMGVRRRWELLSCCFDSPLPEERSPVRLLTDCRAQPHSAAVIMGDFALLYGQADPQLLAGFARPGLLLIGSREWQQLAQERFACRSYQRQRFLLRPDERLLHHLQQLARPVPGTRLEPIGERWFSDCRSREWAADFCSQFACFTDYARWGRGILLIQNDEPVSGASSYLVSRTGFTIQVQTRQDCQRKGYAKTVAAALILEAIQQGLYPDWDADNDASAALAVQLGYTPQERYTTVLLQAQEPEGNRENK